MAKEQTRYDIEKSILSQRIEMMKIEKEESVER